MSSLINAENEAKKKAFEDKVNELHQAYGKLADEVEKAKASDKASSNKPASHWDKDESTNKSA